MFVYALEAGWCRNSGEAPSAADRFVADAGVMQISIVVVSFVIGCILRWACLGHVTRDAIEFLLPWYDFSLRHGWGALASAYTNYTPFYSYLLIGATRLDGLAAPLSLIKGLSFVFEFASACLAFAMVRRTIGGEERLRPAAAFAGVWLAPTVIVNGALWGQADSLWSLFVLLAVAVYGAGRNGIGGFAVALAIKAQAAFLGPFVLGLALRRRTSVLWFAAVPAAYVLLALPVLLAGRSLADVGSVYLGQAQTFHRLSMHAANVWAFVPDDYYLVGTIAGIALALLAGCAFAVAVARSHRSDAAWLLVLACAALLMMPYLLPKMHDRYFYAFEIAAIVLACLDPRFSGLAVVAQVDGIFAYAGFEGSPYGVPIAAVSNGILLVWLVRAIRANGQVGRVQRKPMMLYAACVAVAAMVMPAMQADVPAAPIALAYWLSFVGVVVQTWRLLPEVGSERHADRAVAAHGTGRRPLTSGAAGC